MPTKTGPSKGGKQNAASTDWGLSPQSFDSLVEAQAKAAEIWLQSWTKLADESAGFLSKRWKQDIDLIEQLWACKTPLELLQVQSAFMQTALVDYMSETGKLADLETDAGVAEMDALDKGAREACRPAKPAQKPKSR